MSRGLADPCFGEPCPVPAVNLTGIDPRFLNQDVIDLCGYLPVGAWAVLPPAPGSAAT
jgi:hypothetical protein